MFVWCCAYVVMMWFVIIYFVIISCFFQHIDVIFYYLRKKGKYSASPKVNLTTIGCFFSDSISSLYEKFLQKNRDASVLNLRHSVAQFIKGKKLMCGKPWIECDHVLFPINMRKESHWILGRLNIRERILYMYNLLNSGRYEAASMAAMEPYSVLLPMFFELLNFYNIRKDPSAISIDSKAHFFVVSVDGLPQQEDK